MKTIRADNVNEAFPQAMWLLNQYGKSVDTRNGNAIELQEPVMTEYVSPGDRVLFYPERDANPWLHFFEGLWLLAGRCDVEFLNQFSGNMAQFAEDDGNIWGAYGYRLRYECARDQIDHTIEELKKRQHNRQLVVQMWNVNLDMATVKRDKPCNTHIYLDTRGGKLNMTVLCRSNDAIWGCYGTNVVHFSMLLEYMATFSGYQLGVMRQYSHNLHAYTANPQWQACRYLTTVVDPYTNGEVNRRAMCGLEDKEMWDRDLKMFMENPLRERAYWTNFFEHVVSPMYASWHDRKNKYNNGLLAAEAIDAPDWRRACSEWILRREK